MTAVGGATDVLNEIDYELPRGLVYAIADRLVLKRTLLEDLRSGDRAFNELVRAEAARTS